MKSIRGGISMKNLFKGGFGLTLATAIMLGCLYSSNVVQANQDNSNEDTVPNPMVKGPIPSEPLGNPSRDYPQFASVNNLGKHGYIEEEFFFEGTANSYITPEMADATVKSSDHPYKTRMVVRRPVSDKDFNGTVIVEWLNVTSGYNLDAMWLTSSDHFLREGYAYVGVSAQTVGVHAPETGLINWSPKRYGTLDVTDGGTIMDDSLSYDIFSQATQAVINPGEVKPLGNLSPDQVIAAGASQSARFLVRYHNSIHPLTEMFDAYMIYIGIGDKLREDLSPKVFKVNTETDVLLLGEAAARQPDSNRLRTWEVAGTSHVGGSRGMNPRTEILIRDSLPIADTTACTRPALSLVQTGYAVNSAYEHLVRWVKDGTEPPKAEPIKLNTISQDAERDIYGNALGGIRLPEHAVPTAANTGINGGPGFCFLFGSHEPFDQKTLNTLYPNHGTYVSAVNKSVNENLRSGFIVTEDAQMIRNEASKSSIGKKKGR